MAAITESGSQTHTVGTEHTLTTATSENPGAVAVYVFGCDLNAATGGSTPDIFEIKLKTKIRDADTLRDAFVARYVGVQGTPNKYSPAVVVPNGTGTSRVTSKQTQGTGRAMPWSVFNLA